MILYNSTTFYTDTVIFPILILHELIENVNFFPKKYYLLLGCLLKKGLLEVQL